jgi:hypothetical protein
MRPRELSALDWQDVDLENLCLGVRRKAAHALADRGHNPGPLGAEHVGNLRPDTEHRARPPITVNHSSMRVWPCSPATAPPDVQVGHEHISLGLLRAVPGLLRSWPLCGLLNRRR